MHTSSRSRLQTVSAVAVFLTCPFFLIVALLALGTLNPMAWGFCVGIDVANATEQTVWVTPIGQTDVSRDTVIVPQYHWKIPSVPVIRGARRAVGPGTERRLIYDWDDVNLTGLLVESDDGRQRFLRTQILGPGCCYRPKQTRYEISSLDSLDAPTPEQLAALSSRSPVLALLFVVAAPLFPVFLAVFWITQRKHASA